MANRREDLLAAALEAFVDRGYEGTSIADLARTTGLSKAAFVYHFASKEELLFELAEPLLGDIEAVLTRFEQVDPLVQSNVRDLIADYLDALCAHRATAEWIDGDKSILNHGDLGARLDMANSRFHDLVVGKRAQGVDKAHGSAVLGMLWRPVRNGHLDDDAAARASVVDLVATAVAAI